MNAPVSHIALETVEIDTSDDPLWYRDAVIYQLNVKAFFDSNNDGMGDFKGVTAKLDYVKELGVNTIWLMPFYPSPCATTATTSPSTKTCTRSTARWTTSARCWPRPTSAACA
jgi:hypothetical protein